MGNRPAIDAGDHPPTSIRCTNDPNYLAALDAVSPELHTTRTTGYCFTSVELSPALRGN